MKTKFFYLFFMSYALFGVGQAFSQVTSPNWFMNLREFRSTPTEDALRLIFPIPEKKTDFTEYGTRTLIYKTLDGEIDATILQDPRGCTGLNEPRPSVGTVLTLSFSPTSKPLLKELGLKKKDLIDVWDGHDPAEHLLDPTTGLTFAVQHGRIVFVFFGDMKLSCTPNGH